MTKINQSRAMKRFSCALPAVLYALLAGSNPAFAQTDPSAEISGIIGRIVTIATQVGSAVMILFIIKNAFELMNGNDIEKRGKLARDIIFLLLAAVFLFKPDFILSAIKFITNA